MKGKINAATGMLVVFFLIASGFRKQETRTGGEIFQQYCVACHGQDGSKGKWGARNLQVSRLPDADIMNIITNGRKWMPSWKKKLNPDEIRQVADFVKTLRKGKQ